MRLRFFALVAFSAMAGMAMSYPTMRFLDTLDGRNIKMSLNSGHSYHSVFAGELKMKVSHSFSSSEIVVGYCADPTTRMASGSYGVDIIDTTAISNVGGKIGHMVNTFAPVTLADNGNLSAMALQVAIWEVLVETSGTYDVTQGVFRAKQADGDPFSSSELAAINGFLNAAGNGVARYYRSELGDDCSPKSQSILTPVPEPASFGAVAVGLLTLLRRRIKRT